MYLPSLIDTDILADIFVAAITITNNLVLITNNTDHFSRIKGLRLDNWKV